MRQSKCRISWVNITTQNIPHYQVETNVFDTVKQLYLTCSDTNWINDHKTFGLSKRQRQGTN